MAQHYYKLAIVTGGLAGCAMATRLGQRGLANDNPMARAAIARISRRRAGGEGGWPPGLRHHTAVLMNVSRGETLVRVTYPFAG